MQEIIISKKNGKSMLALIENGVLKEYYEENGEDIRKEGNIYIGRAKDILTGMQSAFIDIGDDKNTFIHLKDILPKRDVKKEGDFEIKETIKNVLKPDMPILVQVQKDATSNKGARVTTHISLPSRFLVLMPDTDILTISQKIVGDDEKSRLMKIFRENLPENIGAIIRTSAENAEEKVLIDDIKNIVNKWDKIKEKASKAKNDFPKLIYKSETVLEKILIDIPKIDRILINDEQEAKKIEKILKELGITQTKIEVRKDEDVLSIYGTNEKIEKLQNRKIWLKCGGFITIDKTEALTAIDVNSGKYTGKKGLEETVLKVNEEATVEIAKQLRLRDIGGIIIIDYIDMKKEENKEKIMNMLKEELKKDRAKTQVLEFTKLNLMELTRKHICSHND